MEFEPWGQPKPTEEPKTATQVAMEKHVVQEPAIRDPLDPDPHIDKINVIFHPKFKDLEKQAIEIKVFDEGSKTTALEMIQQLDKLRIAITNYVDDLTADHRKFARDMSAFKGAWIDTINRIKAIPKEKARVFMVEDKRKKDQEAKEAADKAKKEWEDQQAAEKKAKEQDPDYVKPPEEQQQAPPATPVLPRTGATKTSLGKAKLKKVWKWEIVNFKEIPDECFSERAEGIQAAIAPWINTRIKAGLKVPGVDSWQEDDLKTSTKRKF